MIIIERGTITTLPVTNGETLTGTDEDRGPAFPPEHYGCPWWCTVDHDDADGLPSQPGFNGYTHMAAGESIPYSTAPANPPWCGLLANPLCVDLQSGAELGGLQLTITDGDETAIILTLDEAEAVAAAIMKMVSTGRRKRVRKRKRH
jgi:hypothetical protein